jgi:hypothetical protein
MQAFSGELPGWQSGNALASRSLVTKGFRDELASGPLGSHGFKSHSRRQMGKLQKIDVYTAE